MSNSSSELCLITAVGGGGEGVIESLCIVLVFTMHIMNMNVMTYLRTEI